MKTITFPTDSNAFQWENYIRSSKIQHWFTMKFTAQWAPLQFFFYFKWWFKIDVLRIVKYLFIKNQYAILNCEAVGRAKYRSCKTPALILKLLVSIIYPVSSFNLTVIQCSSVEKITFDAGISRYRFPSILSYKSTIKSWQSFFEIPCMYGK